MDLSVFASPVRTETVWRDLRKIRGWFRSKGIRWTVSSWGLERPSRPATWHVRGAVTLILYKRDTVIELGQPHQKKKKREGKEGCLTYDAIEGKRISFPHQRPWLSMGNDNNKNGESLVKYVSFLFFCFTTFIFFFFFFYEAMKARSHFNIEEETRS